MSQRTPFTKSKKARRCEKSRLCLPLDRVLLATQKSEGIRTTLTTNTPAGIVLPRHLVTQVLA